MRYTHTHIRHWKRYYNLILDFINDANIHFKKFHLKKIDTKKLMVTFYTNIFL